MLYFQGMVNDRNSASKVWTMRVQLRISCKHPRPNIGAESAERPQHNLYIRKSGAAPPLCLHVTQRISKCNWDFNRGKNQNSVARYIAPWRGVEPRSRAFVQMTGACTNPIYYQGCILLQNGTHIADPFVMHRVESKFFLCIMIMYALWGYEKHQNLGLRWAQPYAVR